MTSTTILTILLVFSFMIGRFLRRFETPHFVFSGMIYLLFGLLVGTSVGFGLLDDELLFKLEPLTDLITGIAGFILGLRIKMLLKNKRIFASGALTGLLTFVLLSVVTFFVAQFAVGFDSSGSLWSIPQLDFEFPQRQLWFSLGVAATACSASLLSLGMVSKFHRNTSEITKALSIMAPSLQVMAVMLLGFCLALAKSETSALSLDISLWQWTVATIGSGFLCGLIFSLFIGKQSNPNRIMLAALGALILAAGIGVTLNVSSMVVCFFAGVTISFFSTYADVLKETLVPLEEPSFVLLLVIGGATWSPEFNRIWLLPAVYFLIRAFVYSNFSHRFYSKMTGRKLYRLGQGLLGQDLIAVAIALSLAKSFPGPLSQLFLTTILGSIFLNDFVANSLLKKVILDNEQQINIQTLENQEMQQ